MTTEVDVCWQHLADACLEHDVEHERRAWAELRRLIPEQREHDDADCD